MRMLFALFLFLSSVAFAQRGIAPNGYYPASYRGETFTGTVVSWDADRDTITLEYKKGAKTESVVVKLEGGCTVPSKTGLPMHAKNIPAGTVMTAFFMGKTEKVNGKKERTNVAIGIRFLEWQGKTVSEDNRRKLYRCGEAGGWSYYRAFGTEGGAAVLGPMDMTVPR